MDFNLSQLTPDIRRLNDMREVIYDKEWLKSADNFELYYMYRGLKEADGLRYDVTVIPTKMLGTEFVKTKGHYHIGDWQEVYTVLEGTAIYLMQKSEKSGNKIKDAYFVKVKKGESILIPSGYGHVTINPSENEELKMANWISEDCKSNYSDFEKFQGACYYYVLHSGPGRTGWIKNENYKSVPALREEQPLKSAPKDLNFLRRG